MTIHWKAVEKFVILENLSILNLALSRVKELTSLNKSEPRAKILLIWKTVVGTRVNSSIMSYRPARCAVALSTKKTLEV